MGGASSCKGAEANRGVERNYKVRYSTFVAVWGSHRTMTISREDDANWPKKNIVGKQELEIRLGNDHIAFEVRPL